MRFFNARRPIPFFLLFLLVLSIAETVPSASAAQLEALGPTYPIGEQSALEMIMQRLRTKERSGELKGLQAGATRRALDSVRNPTPVAGLTTVTERRQRVVDPSVTYDKAVTTDAGQIVIPAGTRINPLSVMSLTRRLVFFDGRDAAQRAAVAQLVRTHRAGVKAILVAGSWQELSRAWKTQVYFDQRGTLSQRFGIHAVPTVIRQQGTMLVIEEIPAGELR
jgi:conjugal transfer pilus assembly protein TraW